MILVLTIIILVLLIQLYKQYKLTKANKRLNDLYMKRFAEQERVEKLIEEKPEGIIFVSDLRQMENQRALRFIGQFNSLDKIKAVDWDFVLVNRHEYLYKDGKWYEIINDIPHPLYGY